MWGLQSSLPVMTDAETKTRSFTFWTLKRCEASRGSGKGLGICTHLRDRKSLHLQTLLLWAPAVKQEEARAWGHRWKPLWSLLWDLTQEEHTGPTWLTVKPWIFSPTQYRSSALSQAVVLAHLHAPRLALLCLRKIIKVTWFAGRLANIIQQHNENTVMG